MEDNKKDHSDADGGAGLLGLLIFVGLTYLVYKGKNSTSDGTTTKYLSDHDIHYIVRERFQLEEEEVLELAMYYMMPDFGTKQIKDSIFHNLLFDRLRSINNNIRGYEKSHKGYYPEHNDDKIEELISYIKEFCIEETNKYKSLILAPAKLMSKVPGWGLIDKVASAGYEFKLIDAMKESIKEYFVCIYVKGGDIVRAKEEMRFKFITCIMNTFS